MSTNAVNSITGTVRNVDSLWSKVKYEDNLGQDVVFSLPQAKPQKEEIVAEKGSTEWKKNEIKHKLEEAKRNRDVAAQALNNYTLSRDKAQSYENFKDKSINWLKKLLALDIGLEAGCAMGSELPTTLLGKIGFHVLKIAGGWLGHKAENALSNNVNASAAKTIDPLTNEQRVNISSGITQKEIADCEATIKYWDTKIAKYEKMLEDIEDKELLG